MSAVRRVFTPWCWLDAAGDYGTGRRGDSWCEEDWFCCEAVHKHYEIPRGAKVRVCISNTMVRGAIQSVRGEDSAHHELHIAMDDAGIGIGSRVWWWAEVWTGGES